MKYINLQVVKSVDSINLRLLENHFKYDFDTQTFKEDIAKDYNIDWTKEQILQSDMYVEFNNKIYLKPHVKITYSCNNTESIYFNTIEEVEEFIENTLTNHNNFIKINNNIENGHVNSVINCLKLWDCYILFIKIFIYWK